jgi:prevent-host-death family protein
MLRTKTVSELRSSLASCLEQLDKGPLVVLSHSRPAAVLLDPDAFDRLMEQAEMLEDLLDGQRAIAEYLRQPSSAVDAEEVFDRLSA